MTMGTDGSHPKPFGPPAFGRLNDIHVHQNGVGFYGPNGCSTGRGGCSHMCLPTPGGSRVCACPDGLSLQPNRISCGQGNSLCVVKVTVISCGQGNGHLMCSQGNSHFKCGPG